jgi:hypothetical protein
MNKRFWMDAFGWGFILWLIGFALGMLLFSIVPSGAIGWIIMPIGIAIALWILIKRVKGETFGYYLAVAVIWTLIAILCDYFFMVKAFKLVGYYKLDVYLYYALTFILPLIVGWRKLASQK